MTWQNYVIPVMGSFIILGSCFLLGYYQFSFGWILILVTLNGLKSYMWRQREKRLLGLRQAALREREVILAQLQDLPAWVQFPDTERVEWLNKVILQLWPYITEYSKYFMREYIEPEVKSQLPAIFKSFKFTKMDMGDIPCRVGGIKVYTHNVGRDRIIVDMDIAYAGDADFDVSIAGFTGGLNQLQFSGKLRAILKPLLPYPPMVGGISGFFLEKPKIDFNLTGMGEFVELPGLLNAVRAIIDSQVSALCVLPNEIVVPLAPNFDITKLHLPEPDGVLRLKIVEARNLENRDIKFTKSMASDPYCQIHVGSQFYRTKTIDNNLNPVWNEYFEFVVDQANGQKLRIELFDYDKASSDEELGTLTIDLINVKEKKSLDDWFPLDACKHGDIHIQAAWMNLSCSPADFTYQEFGSYWFNTDKPVHSALLMIFIDSVSDLPYPKAKLEPSPYIMVSVGKDFQQTPTKIRTVNPLFQIKILFFVRYPERQEVKFEAIDHTTKRSLGEFVLPLKTILLEPNLELFEQTFPLTLGVHQSPMVITARIRMKTRRNSSDSATSAYRRRRTFGEKLFLTKHTQSKEKPTGESGRLQFGLQHLKETNKLIVRVIRIIDLYPLDSQGSADPYLTVRLTPSDNMYGGEKRKTAIVKKSLDPVFDNEFEFDLHFSDIENHMLIFTVKDAINYGPFSKPPVLGMVQIKLDSLKITEEFSSFWYDLKCS
ncbi:C2 domain containing protein [Brugia malayi]|uniref:BMA-ESYT-2 n=1 Tax=Brugia malayi TaxID=6279 RepID=A0A0J9Y0Z0_BRUMA|nr:C2 domain containing protein [Brugia malayi]CDP99362.2 BMA-ESYT-2 [Brugia malayi]VIO90608.1 C2 domain containing protein [Brugia malayi]